MDKQIYLHGIYATSDIYDNITTLRILKQILLSDALLSARRQNIKDHKALFNGLDYISLCDYEKRDQYLIKKFNAYESYIKYSLSLIFPKEKLEVITPTVIDTREMPNYYQKMEELGLSNDKRYTDMPDEVQVKDYISLDIMTGLTLPIAKMGVNYLKPERSAKIVMKNVEETHKLLAKYNRDVPIYDIETFESLDNESNVKNLVKEYKNRG